MKYYFQLAGIKNAMLCAILLLSGCSRHNSNLTVVPLPNPAAQGSITPNETAAPDGHVILSWVEPANGDMALRYAIRSAREWSPPQTIVNRKNFDKYPEAPPWVLMLPNRSLISVWSERLPVVKGSKWAGNFLYLSASSDQGRTWSTPAIVHTDRTDGEHSFASLAVDDDNHANIVWLDSRDYEKKHTYRMMSATIASTGSVSDEQTVDDDVCTCCPTSLVKTATGFLAAYRNHTSDEIRDMYTVREEAGKWQTGKSLNNDGWHINACPVNGAALARRQNEVAIAWYTGIEDKSSLQVAFSDDGGATFPTVRKIDVANGEAQPLGRPAIALMSTGHALVVWITHENGKSHLVAAQVDNATPDVRRIDISQGSSDSIGYPRMQLIGAEALISWGGTKESNVNSTLVRTP
ncbi:MAG: sialidase family protein [Candidatus Sulfotelmatobacter sp.]